MDELIEALKLAVWDLDKGRDLPKITYDPEARAALATWGKGKSVVTVPLAFDPMDTVLDMPRYAANIWAAYEAAK